VASQAITFCSGGYAAAPPAREAGFSLAAGEAAFCGRLAAATASDNSPFSSA